MKDKFVGISKVGEKGQIVIPKEIPWLSCATKNAEWRL